MNTVTEVSAVDARALEIARRHAWDARLTTLELLPRHQLADMHLASGGLLRRSQYLTWSVRELAKAVLSDQLQDELISDTRLA